MRRLPSGVFAESYARDGALIRTRKQWLALLIFLARRPRSEARA